MILYHKVRKFITDLCDKLQTDRHKQKSLGLSGSQSSIYSSFNDVKKQHTASV